MKWREIKSWQVELDHHSPLTERVSYRWMIPALLYLLEMYRQFSSLFPFFPLRDRVQDRCHTLCFDFTPNVNPLYWLFAQFESMNIIESTGNLFSYLHSKWTIRMNMNIITKSTSTNISNVRSIMRFTVFRLDSAEIFKQKDQTLRMLSLSSRPR
jgi:hypothetical protein